MELLEQYGICVYRPHELYLLNACQQHNYPLVQRLLNDRVLRPDFLQEAHTTGLLPRSSNSYREPKGHSVRQTILHRFCQNLFYNPEYAADDVKILQALLTQPVRVNAEKYNSSLLQYSCMNLVRSHSHAEAMISCLISHGADVKKLERDMSFTLPANLDLNARSRYLLDVTKSVVAVIDRPIAWLMAICRSEKPEARKLVQRYMAENPKSQKDRGLIGAAMRQACTADNVGALETLLGYTYDPLAFLSTAASEYPAQGRVVEYLKAMGIDYSKGTPLRG
ncbi:hypothetical protein VHEMI03223 [[Torrubiella] hemipterigena]|uniref:Uncharacterized protein n=1 Tax=[Torrubiella] hemipterigena TaxID=1531966 RepID=A0A0A1SS14_9HYPO|nr:hypothetical protein VHEMI03223 [[Torrubiella] hemipterigena]